MTTPLFALTVEQAEWLAQHLRSALTGDDVYDAVATLDDACSFAFHKPITDQERDHLIAINDAATILAALLRIRRPLFATFIVDWDRLHQMLNMVAFAASSEAGLGVLTPRSMSV